jgi:hypothetical protein
MPPNNEGNTKQKLAVDLEQQFHKAIIKALAILIKKKKNQFLILLLRFET